MILFIIPTSLFAVELDRDYTLIYQFTTDKGYKIYYPVRNGYFWAKLGLKEQLLFLDGMKNGERLLYLNVYENKNSENVINKILEGLEVGQETNFKLSEISAQIDMFYEDAANLNIPVIEAYRYVTKRTKGATSLELDNLAATLRKKYNLK
ncbi:MAG: hypothetical protein Q8P28_06405 [Deltaproteobacteria bacterium]|nr:hypothetical protein [Deltaproteobacteria bacterium]